MLKQKAVVLEITEKQRNHLEEQIRRQKSPQDLIKRSRIILKVGEGMSNRAISKDLGVERNTVMKWQKRWSDAASGLKELETKGELKELYKAIEDVLSDAYRSGTPTKFSAEQIVQIMALACESPSLSKRAISHWTPRELADEAIKRGIVESISSQSVERFLKGSVAEASSIPLLVDERTQQRP